MSSSLRTRIVTVAVSGALAAAGAALLAGPASASTPQCTSLVVTNAPAEGATGHGSAVLFFKNNTHTTCTVYGYPGLDAVNSSGGTLAHATRTLSGFAGGPGVEKTVTLGYGQVASAIVEWLNFNPVTSGACTSSAAVHTTPPNTSYFIWRPIHTTVCGLQIHPVQAGADGLGDYVAAQTEWLAAAKVASVYQSAFWTKAKTYLAASGTGQYATQISELTQLIAIPETGLTPTQIALAHKLVAELNTFFQTPGLYA